MDAEIDRLEIQIESEAEKANRALEKLADRLEKISYSIAGIDTAKISRFTNGIDKITKTNTGTQKTTSNIRKLSDAFSVLSTRTTRSARSFKSFSSAAGRFYANSFMMIRGLKKGWSSVDSSMDFLETVNYFEVAMRKIGDDAVKTWNGNGYDSAEAYAQSFSDRAKQLTTKMTGFEVDNSGNATYTGMTNLGMNPDDVMQWQAVYAQMTDSLGLAEESTLNFSKALTMLGGDWASLRNLDFDTTWNKFASALAGQSRAVRSLGIDITQTTLQEYAYKYGLNQAIQEMNQATKAQLRLLAILDQSKVAYGDLANTIASPSNQLRMLRQNFANLSRTIGNLFVPIVEKVLPYVNGLVLAVRNLFEWVGKLFGIKFESINPSAGGMPDEMADMVDEAEEFSGALDDADKSAKKLKSNLQGWHEINNISTSDNGKSGSGTGYGTGIGGGSPVLDAAIAEALANYENEWNEAFARMENKAQEFADKLTAWAKNVYDAITPFREAVITLWNEGLSKLANFTWNALGDFYNEFLVPIGEWAFTDENTGITRLVHVINDGLMSIEWELLNTSLKNFWIAIEPYAEQFGEGLIDFFEDVQGLAIDIINKFPGLLDGFTMALNNGNPETARSWGYALGELWLGLSVFKLGSLVAKGILAIYNAIKIVVASDIFTAFSAGLSSLFGNSAATSALAFLPKVAKLLSGIGSIISGLGVAVSNFFLQWKYGFSWLNEILMVLGIALAAVGAVILGVPAAIAAIVAAVVAAVSSIVIVVKEHWAQICEFCSGIAEWININVIEPVVSFFVGFGNRIQQIFEGLWIIIQAAWITVSDWFNEHVVQPLVKFFTPLYIAVTSIFKKIWSDIQLVWGKVSTWVDEHVIQPVVKLFDTLSFGIKSTFRGAINSTIAGIESAINWIVNGINLVVVGFNKLVSWAAKVSNTNWGGVELVPSVNLPRISMYAAGGMPETGELFMARENGINEMVGKIGNRSAVANNDQIVEAVSYGVSMANAETNELLRQNNQLLAAILQKDNGWNNDSAFKSVRNSAFEFYRRTGAAPFPG